MIVIESNLVDRFSPGDDVVVVGQMTRKWRPLYRNQRCELYFVIKANSVHTLNSRRGIKSQLCESVHLFKKYWKLPHIL